MLAIRVQQPMGIQVPRYGKAHPTVGTLVFAFFMSRFQVVIVFLMTGEFFATVLALVGRFAGMQVSSVCLQPPIGSEAFIAYGAYVQFRIRRSLVSYADRQPTGIVRATVLYQVAALSKCHIAILTFVRSLVRMDSLVLA